LITSALLNDNPVMIRQYIWFLLGKNQPGEAAVVAPRLISLGKVETDRPQMLSVVDRLVASNKPVAANQLWHSLVERNWVTADATVPNNRRFAREPLPVKFDWSIPEYSGLHSWPGPSGLESEFTGVEPEDCTVAEQFLVLSPGKYTMSFTYRTSEIPPDTGLTWEVVDESTNKILGESHYLSAESLRQSGIGFEVAAESSLLRLRLHYRRVLGTPRISGKLVVESTEVQKIP